MAIYHFSMQGISRGAGRSTVAAAAYRSGEKLRDERTGELFDYQRRSGVIHSEIFLPDGSSMERTELWNLVEAAEKRKDAKVGRELVIALPHELSQEQQLALLREYAQGLSTRQGWAVDVAMHAPGRAGDQRNTHAHLLCSTRTIERDPAGCPVMRSKTKSWDSLSEGPKQVASERAEWAEIVNRYLAQAQILEWVDHRSHEERGLETLPTQHVGVHAMALERRGIATERGEHNRAVQRHNAEVIELSQVKAEREEAQAWERELARFETLSLSELEKEARHYYPSEPRQLALRDPAVQEAERPFWEPGLYDFNAREAFARGEFGWLSERNRESLEKAVHGADCRVRHAQNDEARWRNNHPWQAGLFDLGLPNRALGDLVERRQEAEVSLSACQRSLADFDRKRVEAKRHLESVIQKALPEATRKQAKLLERYPSIEAILERKRELDRQQRQEQERERGKGQSRDQGGGRSMGW